MMTPVPKLDLSRLNPSSLDADRKPKRLDRIDNTSLSTKAESLSKAGARATFNQKSSQGKPQLFTRAEQPNRRLAPVQNYSDTFPRRGQVDVSSKATTGVTRARSNELGPIKCVAGRKKGIARTRPRVVPNQTIGRSPGKEFNENDLPPILRSKKGKSFSSLSSSHGFENKKLNRRGTVGDSRNERQEDPRNGNRVEIIDLRGLKRDNRTSNYRFPVHASGSRGVLPSVNNRW